MGDAPPDHSHLVDFPEALEALCARLRELKVVVGPAAAPGVDQVAETLRQAIVARQRGDLAAAVAAIGQAMDRLAAVASQANPAEGAALRAMAERFHQALVRGVLGDAKEVADAMRDRSGSALRPRKER